MSTHPMKWSAWVLAARPKTLTAALVPILVGTCLSWAVHGRVKLEMSVLAFLSALFIQIGTNLINDALDFKKGADTAERVGPKRVTQSGIFTLKQVWCAGMVAFFLAALLGIPLLIEGGWPIFFIGLFSLLCGYSYTGGPFPLAYHGLGDFFVLIFFGWVSVSGVYYLNCGTWDFNGFWAGTQVGLLATVMIAINNLRDRNTDLKSGKKTLAVRYGVRFSRMEIAFLCLFPFLGGYFWVTQGHVWAFFLPWVWVPLSIQLTRKICRTDPGAIYNQFLAQGALLHLGFGILLSVGFCLR